MIIDFLIELFTPMEGVDYALAPIVIAALTQVPGLIKGSALLTQLKIKHLETKKELRTIRIWLKEPLLT